MSTLLDAEDLRKALRAYQHLCDEVIDRFGGFIAQYLGDGILAYFGYPSSDEREAENAVRAGLALLTSVPQVAARVDVRLEMRIGIASGLTVIGDLIGLINNVRWPTGYLIDTARQRKLRSPAGLPISRRVSKNSLSRARWLSLIAPAG